MIELTTWWRSIAVSDKPWLILGKGPTFAYHKQIELAKYHLLSLNHVVRELQVDVAHIIDIDVVRDCQEAVRKNCRWLLMPRYPHVHCEPTRRRLEEFFDEYPVLRDLADQRRLVWYNLSSAPASGTSPVIQARFFSAEAALNILGTLGVREVRSLGVDGGRGYSGTFRDLQGKTHLANGRDSFDCQSAEIDKIKERWQMDYTPLYEPMRVFVGTDESQLVAARVLEYTIRKHASSPVTVHPMLQVSVRKPRHEKNRPRTGFSFARFVIPKLCGYRGRALYVDADMQVFSDLAELWAIPFNEQKVLCTNQPTPPAAWRFPGAFFHPGRQMSVMLLDCSRLDWDVEKIVDGLDQERYDYQQLMFELCIVAPGEIADRIPPEWNCLEWFEPGRSKLVHYTVVPTQPWKNDENPLRSIWEASYVEAVRAGAVQAKEVLAGIRAGFLKPSLADAFAPEALSQAAEELKVPQLSARTAWRAAQSVRRRIGRLVRAPLAGIQRRLAPNQRRTPRNSPSAFFAESRKVALARQPAVEGMIPLTDLELQGFQTALDWKTGLQLPDGRLLGVAGKRGKVSVGVDPRVQLVADRLQPRHKHILELGCCEGIHTVQLARICRHVTALEVRPSNIACALVRLFVHDVHNATVKLWDVRDLDESFGRFEILFHVGVLYHLIDPVEHLFRIRELANELVLDTHVCLDDTRFPRADVTYDGRTYRAHLYEGESGWFERFSGLEPNSRWLHRDALLQVLRDAGFATADLVDERIERNGPRVTLLARRTGAALGQADGQPRQQGLAAA